MGDAGHTGGLWNTAWPPFDAELAKDEEVEVVVQVNGRVRAKLRVAAGLSEAEIVPKALAEPAVAAHIAGKEVVKWIVVQDKLVNLVVRSMSGKPETKQERWPPARTVGTELGKNSGLETISSFP